MAHAFVCFAVLVFLFPAAQATAGRGGGRPIAIAITTQLPVGVVPTHYALSVTPDVQAMTFSAHVQINITVAKPTRRISLNAVDLTFGKVILWDARGKVLAARRTEVRANDQMVVVHFSEPIGTGDYRLDMDYDGLIGTQAAGLFALSYATPAGTQRGLYTQFENSDARRFLPSWDEPNYKATFSLAATLPSADLAVSNMPIETRSDAGNGKVAVQFGTTPRMSTYLLFLGSGDFERATTQLGQTELGVVTKRGSLEHAKEVLEASKLVLAEFNDYFGVPYPLPKLDNIAAPGSNAFFGAMENWGAILTFERSMLIDPEVSTAGDRKRVFSTAAHEIAHQWFGNLVTMQWWDDLWLNEGFASWMESRTTAKLHPEWNSHFENVETRSKSMEQDALKTTHPVVQPIKTVEQASQAFDSITYGKGQSVIHMLESFIGADTWREGVRSYMKRYAHLNTNSGDFWAEMDKSSGHPVSAMARDFTLQPGVPLIRVAEPKCKDGRLTLNLVQSEFSDDQPHKKPLHWRVPVKALSVDAGHWAQTTVKGGRGRITLDNCSLAVLNAGQTGYFRTVYSAGHFQALVKQFNQLAGVDQLGILLDTWALGAIGAQPASNYLDLVEKTSIQADSHVWQQIAEQLGATHRWFDNDVAHQTAFDKFAAAKLSPVLAGLGWEERANDSHSSKLLRNRVIRALSALGDSSVIAEARRRYSGYRADPGATPAELRRTLLDVVALHADALTWEQLHADAQAEKTSLIRNSLYKLLATAQDKTLAQRALKLALTDEVGETNSAAMISQVADLHPEMAFEFALENLEVVTHKVDPNSRSRFYPSLVSHSAQNATVPKLKAYAKPLLSG
jgi:aminopeptidase N